MKTNQQKKNKKNPDVWEIKKLGTLFDIKRGGSPRPIDKFITEDKDGLNWLKIGDIEKGAKYINKTSSKIKLEGLKKTTLVKKGDFILSNSMSFGRPYILNIDTCIHDGWLTFQDIKDELLDRDFLYFLLLHPKTQNEFINISAGSGVQNLKKETVTEVALDFPPLPEQKRIVAVLEVWDEYLEKLKRKIEIKKNIKKGLMQQLLTGKKRLDGFSGGWVEKTLKDVSVIAMGQSPSSEFYNEEKKGKPLIQGNADLKLGMTVERVFTSECTREGVYQDIILTVRAPVADIGIVVQNKVCLGRGVCSIQANYKNDQRFLYYILIFSANRLRRFEQGSTFTSVNSNDVKNLKLNIPILKEQKAIAKILTTADEEIDQLLRQQKLVEEQKKFLLNNLISGDIRTSEDMVVR